MAVCNFFLFIILILALSTHGYDALEQTRLNTNTANFNLLLSESGRNPSSLGPGSATKSGYPPLAPPSLTHTQPSNVPNSGKVHDLVGFYNNQGKATNAPSKPLSYSSVVTGTKPQFITPKPANGIASTNFKSATPAPSSSTAQSGSNPLGLKNTDHSSDKGVLNPAPQSPSIAPMIPSYSNILSGNRNSISNKNSAPITPKPHSVGSGGGSKPVPAVGKPTSSPVMPSTILANNNRQGNQPNGPTDRELQTLSEELLRKDTNNAARLITINYQEKTTSQSKDDKAPQPLVTIPAAVNNIATISKFLPLLDNYERDTLVNEYVTPQERNEENVFMDTIMSTQVIRQLMTFLKDKGYVTPDPRQQRDFLKQMWFNLYSRGRGKISSSGFEHVFVSELKNGEVSGLHNWLYFAKEESANRANYLGYLKYEQLGDKGAVLKLHFNQQGTDKPVDSMFVGTSPELEMALYTVCFVTRADQSCPLKLGGKSVNIVTHTFRYRSKNMIGSAYPQI